MFTFARAVFASLSVALIVGGVQAAPKVPLPRIKSLPASLPTSTIKQEGKMQPVRSLADGLPAAVTKVCPGCGGDGQAKEKGTNKGFAKSKKVPCEPCNRTGRLPNDETKVEAACLNLVGAIVRMQPDTQGASIALTAAYEAITKQILENKRNFMFLQAQSAAVLSQVKPQVDKMVLVKGIFSHEMPHPTRPEERVFVLRIAHKKQVIAVVAPKQADPPLAGGRSLVAGVIAGTIDVDAGMGEGKDRVVILERGFLIAPNLDNGWWNAE